ALVLIDPTILPFSWMWWWYVFKLTGLTRFVPIVATAAKRFRAKVPGAAFRMFEATGHFVPMERPDETADVILEFLKNEYKDF
ncbi:MAG: hypothetical protein PVI00_03070, partial [Desulfobacterales bacterium]